ncbi:MAG: methionine adenosyltransferase [Candidatus Nanohaloarchaea archaeon]
MNASVEEIGGDPVKERQIEQVERKGTGHPDSICDGIAENVSRKLCREYRDRFDKILHHNTDEAQLVAGESDPEIGGGEVVEPIYILLTGRATKSHEGEDIPVERLAVEAAREYIQDNFRELSPEHVELDTRIGETSADLREVFDRGETPPANDTSFGVGHAPLSPLERAVKEIEKKAAEEIDAVGEDVKVMGLRQDNEIRLTVASAVIAGEISSRGDYRNTLEEVKNLAAKTAKRHTGRSVSVDVNTADTGESIYITETGTSAEMGDDGSVGRGNRVNGLITPNRAMSLEAASGKNPVTHVGKIYNLLADRAARKVYGETGEFAQVKLLSQIGEPLNQPQAIDIETSGEKQQVRKIVEEEVSKADEIVEDVIKGDIRTF